MKRHRVATVVNFCTNESRFLKPCLEQARLFSSQIVVSLASHFFDGAMENRDLLERIYAAFPGCLFAEYPFIPDQIPESVFKKVQPEAFWHCLSRAIGASILDEAVEFVLFLDADEIVDGRRMLDWLDRGGYEDHRVVKLANYWYFREPRYRAEALEDSAVLVRKDALSPALLFSDGERNSIYDCLLGLKRRMVAGLDGKPLIHHFSWVRTEEEMLKKVRSWGHRKDRDWETLVRREFAAPFRGVDFVHGYHFSTIDPPFDVTFRSFEPEGEACVRRFTDCEVKTIVDI